MNGCLQKGRLKQGWCEWWAETRNVQDRPSVPLNGDIPSGRMQTAMGTKPAALLKTLRFGPYSISYFFAVCFLKLNLRLKALDGGTFETSPEGAHH